MLALPLAAPVASAAEIRTVLDGLMVAASLLLCSWIAGAPATSSTPAATASASTVISLAYPVGDVVLITMVVYHLARARAVPHGSLPVSLPLLGSGLLAFAVADSGFTYETTLGVYSSGSIIDLGWFTGFSLILVLASLRRESSQRSVTQEDEVGQPAARQLAARTPPWWPPC